MIVFKPKYNTPIEGKVYVTLSRYLDEIDCPQTLREYKKFVNQKIRPYKALILAHAVTGNANSHSIFYTIGSRNLTITSWIKRMKIKDKDMMIHHTFGNIKNSFNGMSMFAIKKQINKFGPEKVSFVKN